MIEFELNNDVGPSLDPCVFLFGCDRSGTTLLRSMMNSHPELLMTYEAPASIMLEGAFSDGGYRAVIDAMRCFPQFDSVNWVGVIDELSELENVSLADTVGAAYRNLLVHVGKSRWGDKTPAYTRFIDTLAEMYPNGTFIHIVRDPRAVALSWIAADWGPNTAFHAGREWLQRVSEANVSMELLPESRKLTVRYEDLMASPEQVLKTICEKVDIDYSSEMVVSRGKESNAMPDQYLQKLHARSQEQLDPSRSERWRSMNRRQIGMIEANSWELMQEFDYEPCNSSAPQVSSVQVTACKLENRCRQFLNRFRQHGTAPPFPLPQND
ncbi:sulfotransferase family protein [Rubripirellula reticaptiva]|uniref:Sulfotransferase domain protein n=1 Tax=Rubripirellula reticaptiva TaxID=2528013 RepID=A0A5C6FBG7_9BACT|nr:sulfotransferase [Rubripirellula reticaptiva]TWU57897.1 Sulfotransferase domain protein [Rubripirellula reticaptiva]